MPGKLTTNFLQKKPQRSSLSEHLLKSVTSIYLIIAIAVTSVELYLEFLYEEDRINSQLIKLTNTYMPLMSSAMWKYDDEQLKDTMESLLSYDEVIGISVSNSLGEPQKYGTTSPINSDPAPSDKNSSKLISYAFDINFDNPSTGTEFIGSGTIYSSYNTIFEGVYHSFFIILISALVKTAFLCGITHFFIMRMIAKPLHNLSDNMRQFEQCEDIDLTLAANEKHLDDNDEIAELKNSFLEMGEKIKSKNTVLLNNQKTLEKIIDLRTRDLQLINDKLKSESQEKSALLANMSHDIRTPMNGVMGITQLLKETTLNDQQKDYVDMIYSSSESLLGILNDILDLSKIEAGKLHIINEPFDLHKLIHDVAALFNMTASNSGVKLATDINPDTPQWIISDATRIRQILVNLIGNAFKFTESGLIRIKTGGTIADDNKYSIEFKVIDSGIGMNDEQQQRVFDSFTQAESDTTKKYGGTGLGLSICKQLTQLMGGDIHVSSQLGKGSTFTFTILCAPSKSSLPVDQIVPKEAISTAQSDELAGFSQLSILVAEDNPVNQAVITGMLKRLGISANIANDGNKAVEMFVKRKTAYDLVFMDCEMPQCDGYDATRRIRDYEKGYHHAYIVALSAHAMEEQKQKAFEAGMDAYLSKPIKMEELVATLTNYTKNYHRTHGYQDVAYLRSLSFNV